MITYSSPFSGYKYRLKTALTFKSVGTNDINEIKKDILDESLSVAKINDDYFAVIPLSEIILIDLSVGSKIKIEFLDKDISIVSTNDNLELVYSFEKALEDLMELSNAGYENCLIAMKEKDPIQYLKDNNLFVPSEEVVFEISLSYKTKIYLDSTRDEAVSQEIDFIENNFKDIVSDLNIISVKENNES